MHKLPIKSSTDSITSTRKLQIVHSDLCGLVEAESLGGKKYFITFIDDLSRCCMVYFLKHKSDAFEAFKQYEAVMTNATGKQVEILRTDNGGEYCAADFEGYVNNKGIVQLTAPHTPGQNGVAERMNRTLLESARTTLAHAHLPKHFWPDAVFTAVYLKNRVPSSALNDKSPFESWHGSKPDLSNARAFGCIAYAHVVDKERK